MESDSKLTFIFNFTGNIHDPGRFTLPGVDVTQKQRGLRAGHKIILG